MYVRSSFIHKSLIYVKVASAFICVIEKNNWELSTVSQNNELFIFKILPTAYTISKTTKTQCISTNDGLLIRLCLVQQRSVSPGASHTPAQPSCLWRGCTWQASAPGSNCLSRCPSTPSSYLTWVCTARISATSSSATSLSNPPWWHWSRQVRVCSAPAARLSGSADWPLAQTVSISPCIEMPLVSCHLECVSDNIYSNIHLLYRRRLSSPRLCEPCVHVREPEQSTRHYFKALFWISSKVELNYHIWAKHSVARTDMEPYPIMFVIKILSAICLCLGQIKIPLSHDSLRGAELSARNTKLHFSSHFSNCILNRKCCIFWQNLHKNEENNWRFEMKQ